LALLVLPLVATRITEDNKPTMAIPTISSIKVKPFCLFLLVIDISSAYLLLSQVIKQEKT
jgi:hypothetical protein